MTWMRTGVPWLKKPPMWEALDVAMWLVYPSRCIALKYDVGMECGRPIELAMFAFWLVYIIILFIGWHTVSLSFYGFSYSLWNSLDHAMSEFVIYQTSCLPAKILNIQVPWEILDCPPRMFVGKMWESTQWSSGWWFGTFELFFHILEIIIPTD